MVHNAIRRALTGAMSNADHKAGSASTGLCDVPISKPTGRALDEGIAGSGRSSVGSVQPALPAPAQRPVAKGFARGRIEFSSMLSCRAPGTLPQCEAGRSVIHISAPHRRGPAEESIRRVPLGPRPHDDIATVPVSRRRIRPTFPVRRSRATGVARSIASSRHRSSGRAG